MGPAFPQGLFEEGHRPRVAVYEMGTRYWRYDPQLPHRSLCGDDRPCGEHPLIYIYILLKSLFMVLP